MKPDWITLDKTSGIGGGQIKVIVFENTSSSERSGNVTVQTLGGKIRTLTVTQKGVSTFFKIKKEFHATFENYYEEITKAIASFSVVYCGKEYDLFSGDVLSGYLDGMTEDLNIPYVVGESMSFKVTLSMSTATGPAWLASTSFTVFVNGNELMGNTIEGGLVSDTIEGYVPSPNEDISLEFYMNVTKV